MRNEDRKTTRWEELYRTAAQPSGDTYAVILAGEDAPPDGRRVPAIHRGQRPLQYLRTGGNDFVLRETFEHVSKWFPPENIFFVVTESHLSFFEDVLADVPRTNLFIQPQDDGSAFAIQYAAMRISMKNPFAPVAFFPSDLNVPNIRSFMESVQSALDFARRQLRLVLLGFQPDANTKRGEVIEPELNASLDSRLGIMHVRRVSANAGQIHASSLIEQGSLVNSPVIVGTAAAFLRSIRDAAPQEYNKLISAGTKIGTRDEEQAVRTAYYSNYEYTDFHRDILPKISEGLAVLPVPVSLTAGARRNLPSLLAPPAMIAAPRFAVAGTGWQ
ncbi:MAG: hypothetical protein ABI791_10295 [Acidobacteriota bacterium]